MNFVGGSNGRPLRWNDDKFPWLVQWQLISTPHKKISKWPPPLSSMFYLGTVWHINKSTLFAYVSSLSTVQLLSKHSLCFTLCLILWLNLGPKNFKILRFISYRRLKIKINIQIRISPVKIQSISIFQLKLSNIDVNICFSRWRMCPWWRLCRKQERKWKKWSLRIWV